jgi:hypothetical protein
MRRLSVVFVACAALLSGCLGGDVSRVKESRMKGWPDFTVGQLLGTRKACSSTEWKSFTDTRDRKVVEYSCDYAPGTAYLKAKHVEDMEEARKHREASLADLVKSAEYDQERIALAQAKVRGQLEGSAELEGQLEGLKVDVQRLQQLSKNSTCRDLDKNQFNHPQVVRFLQELTKACDDGSASRDPDFGRSVELTKVRAISWARQTLPSLESGLARQETTGLESAMREVQQLTEYAEKNKASRERLAPQRQAEHEARMARLERRGANFEKVREVSQWAVQEQGPVYLGSRVDLVFSDGVLEQPVDADFVFTHASRDSADLHAIYQIVLDQTWSLYGKKQ